MTQSKPEPAASRQAKWKAKVVKAGGIRVCRWIPADGKADFEKAVERLRKSWKKQGLE